MHIVRGARSGAPSEQRTATFTGTVFADPVLPETDGVLINTVFFAPGARTYWHSHSGGQVLLVTAGRGLVLNRDGEGGEINAGDVVFIPPGVEHWHGAAADSFMTHVAVSLQGHEWLAPVSDDEYRDATPAAAG